MVNDVLKPGRPPCPGREHISVEALGEDPAPAQDGMAVEPAGKDHQPNWVARDRQVRQAPPGSAVDPVRPHSASRAGARLGGRADSDHGAAAVIDCVVHDKTARNERRSANCLLHDVDPLETEAKQRRNSIKSESEPPFNAD